MRWSLPVAAPILLVDLLSKELVQVAFAYGERRQVIGFFEPLSLFANQLVEQRTNLGPDVERPRAASALGENVCSSSRSGGSSK